MTKEKKGEGGFIKGVYLYEEHQLIIDAVKRLEGNKRKDSKIIADAIVIAYGHLISDKIEDGKQESTLDVLVAQYYARRDNLPMNASEAKKSQMNWIKSHLAEFNQTVKYRTSDVPSIYEDLEMSEDAERRK